jgi:hydrogenase maturation protease
MAIATLGAHYTAPILVLGLGNTEAGDDGLGPVLVSELSKQYRYTGGFIEFVNGGTRGLSLLNSMAGRQAVVVLDAVEAGGRPGTVSVLKGSDVVRYAISHPTSTLEGNAGELLATAAFLGDLPEHCYIVSVEPANRSEGPGLSHEVERSLQPALLKAQDVVDELLVELSEPVHA